MHEIKVNTVYLYLPGERAETSYLKVNTMFLCEIKNDTDLSAQNKSEH